MGYATIRALLGGVSEPCKTCNLVFWNMLNYMFWMVHLLRHATRENMYLQHVNHYLTPV